MENQNKEHIIEQPTINELSKEEKLDKILTAINEEGKSLTEVAKELGYKNSDGVGKFLKRAGYKKKGKKYILETKEKTENNNKCDNKPSIEDILNQIKLMSERLDKIESKDNEGIIVSNEKMNYKSTSIRVDENILAEFDQVCDSFTNVSKSYLISLAFKEFVDKYGNKKKTK